MTKGMIYKINGRYAPIEVFDWFLTILKTNGQEWVSNKYNENGFQVKDLMIL